MKIFAYTDPALQGKYRIIDKGHASQASDLCNAIINYCINYKPETKQEPKQSDVMYHGDMTDVIIKSAINKVGLQANAGNYNIAKTNLEALGNVHPDVAFAELVSILTLLKPEEQSDLDTLTNKIAKIKCELDCTVDQALAIIKFERGI